jgi:excisionase family DNA binding protein
MLSAGRAGVMLRPYEVAQLLGVHWRTVKRLPPSELPYVRVNARGDRRYRLEDVQAYLERRRVTR